MVDVNTVRQDAIDLVNDRMQSFPVEKILAVLDFVMMLTPEEPKKEFAAKGILHHFADPSKIPLEEGAWAEAAVEKHKRLMEEMREAD